MGNLSAISVVSAVVITVALIASILSLAVDHWGQVTGQVATEWEQHVRLTVRIKVVSYYTLCVFQKLFVRVAREREGGVLSVKSGGHPLFNLGEGGGTPVQSGDTPSRTNTGLGQTEAGQDGISPP